MLCKTTLLIFSLLMVIAYSYEATLIKTLFYLDPANTFTQPFFQTKNNVIGYNVEFDTLNNDVPQVPHFYTINLQNNSATPFFEDTMAACGHSNATYVRMFYHSNTSTLVYYCTSNNTLLILNEDDYTVKNQVQVTTTGVFDETKLYAEDNSVVILGMATPYLVDSIPTQLIKIDLTTFQVIRQATFDSNLAAGEVVTAYTSTNLFSFVLTTTVDKANYEVTLTIYNAIFVSNSYKLTRLTTFNYSMQDHFDFQFYSSELLCLGGYLVTNDDYNLLIYNVQGELFDNITDLYFVRQGPYNTNWLLVPTYAMQHGSSTLYAHYLNGTVAKFTTDGQDITQNVICNSGLVSFVLGNQYAHDLLFSIDTFEIDQYCLFSIIDPRTSEVLYRTPSYVNGYGSIAAITNSSYIVSAGGSDLTGIVTYGLETNLVLGYFQEDYLQYFFEEVEQVYYYIVPPGEDANECTIKYYDPQTFVTGFVYSYNEGIPCIYAVFEALEASGSKYSPNFVIWMNENTIIPQLFNKFLIHTQTYDHITVSWPRKLLISPAHVVPNFETMKMYYIRTGTEVPYDFTVNTYVFDKELHVYILHDFYNLEHQIDYSDYNAFAIIDPDTVAFAPGNCMIINLASGKAQEYSSPNSSLLFGYVSTFKDTQNQNLMILPTHTEDLKAGPTYMMDLDGALTVMPESNQYTQTIGPGTGSRLWFIDVYPSAIQVLRFYDSFSENQNVIPQQQQKQNIFDIFDILQ